MANKKPTKAVEAERKIDQLILSEMNGMIARQKEKKNEKILLCSLRVVSIETVHKILSNFFFSTNESHLAMSCPACNRLCAFRFVADYHIAPLII